MEKPLTGNFRPDKTTVSLPEYERAGGYQGLRKALSMQPSEVTELVKRSNLRGRGGAGFPTATKWSFVPMGKEAPHPKYLVANADEMEPGTFKDRALMERDPHQLIEGLIVAAYAIEADIGYIFLRGEYARSNECLSRAIAEATASNYLGRNILGSGYSLEIHLHASAGRYICGEETALLNALEGKRAHPRAKPPFPQVCGLWGKPTIVQNVETLCNVHHIVNNGPDWFRGLSRSDDGGTKLFGVSGKVRRPGLWELPMGTPMREILEDHAGGMRDGLHFRGILPGGASTDFLVEEHLDTPMDYGNVQKAGSRLGTGTMIVLDDQTCPVGMVWNLEHFFAQESCGWCTPCWSGLAWTEKILFAMEQGRGSMQDLDTLLFQTKFLCSREHLLRFCTWSSRTPSKCAEILCWGFPPTHRRTSLSLEMTVATIYIDNMPRQVNSKQNLLHVCLSLGYDLPYFCWHPALGSVGACRQCAVKQFRNEQDTVGKLVMACMTPVADGARISIADPEAVGFRAAVIQGLMQNHPHDCPVCDEGGECHLQDMTVMTGHRSRIYSFGKRTFRNQYLGPLVNHEMNRCIQCQRCVRFYREYAGGHDLNAFHLRDTIYYGRHEDGVLESEFSGNLVEICPTGVFTDATLKRHYTRKWDLQMAPSICVHCGLGCNTTIGERYGTLRRVVNRYNHEVNGYFLCDRGRFGYEFVESNLRIRHPLLDGKAATKGEALERFGAILREGKAFGIGSPRASLESNFALRTLVGPDRFFAGTSDQELQLLSAMLRILRDGPARSPSLNEVEHSDAVFVLGEDITNVAPIMALRLRQSVRQAPMPIALKLQIPEWLDQSVREAVQDAKGPLFIASPYATKLDDIATATHRGAPDDLARLGFAVAHAIDPSAPAVTELLPELEKLAANIASALLAAHHPLVVSGASCGSQSVIGAAAQVAWALCKAGRPAALSFTTPECNSFGLALMEPRPLSEVFSAIKTEPTSTLIVVENDLFCRGPAGEVASLLGCARHLVALDHLNNATTEAAELVLPAGTFAESDGTLVNNEGRAQRFFQVFDPSTDVQGSWRWLREGSIAAEFKAEEGWQSLDDLTTAMAAELAPFASIPRVESSRKAVGKIAREPNRYSGRTSMLADISVHEPKPPDDPDSSLAFSMESGLQSSPPSLIPFVWAPGWNSVQATNKFQTEVGGPLSGGDPGIRLIEPLLETGRQYYSTIPAAFRPRPNEWLLVPIFHIFGSEELSRHAQGIAQLTPPPCLSLNPEEASLSGVHAGERIKVSIEGAQFELEAVLRSDLPRGVAGLPAGLSQTRGIIFPVFCRLVPVLAERSRGAP